MTWLRRAQVLLHALAFVAALGLPPGVVRWGGDGSSAATIRPHAGDVAQDALRVEPRAEPHVLGAARSDRTPASPASLARTAGLAGPSPIAQLAVLAMPAGWNAQPSRLRRALRMESDDPPRV